jgi:trk system potassium uptake protein TrkA
MNVIVVGDGVVGYTLADFLSREGHNVVFIDKDAGNVKKASQELDVSCIRGNGQSTGVLFEAGIRGTDVLIAATTSDEVNMVCCLTAKKLGAKYTVARIGDPEYAEELAMLKDELEIDMIINPERETALEISRIIRLPAAIHVESFLGGSVEMVEYRVNENDTLVGIPLHVLARNHPNMLFCAVERHNDIIIPNGGYEMRAGDIIYVIGEPTGITKFFKDTGKYVHKIKNAMIIGGGRVAYYLSKILLNMGIKIKIIELDRERCVELNELLPRVMVINGDGMEQELLDSENIEVVGAFIAITSSDEDNVMASMYALQRGIAKIITRLNKINYTRILNNLGFDSVISHKLIMANLIMRYVRSVDSAENNTAEGLYKMLSGNVEVLEFTATSTTHFLNTKLKELNLIKNLLISAIARGSKIIIPRGDDCILEGDKVIITTTGENITDLNQIFMTTAASLP